MAEEATLQMVNVSFNPKETACLTAAKVSAVSPDWVTVSYTHLTLPTNREV